MHKFVLSFLHGIGKTYYNMGPSAYSTDFPKSRHFSALANFDLQNEQNTLNQFIGNKQYIRKANALGMICI